MNKDLIRRRMYVYTAQTLLNIWFKQSICNEHYVESHLAVPANMLKVMLFTLFQRRIFFFFIEMFVCEAQISHIAV